MFRKRNSILLLDSKWHNKVERQSVFLILNRSYAPYSGITAFIDLDQVIPSQYLRHPSTIFLLQFRKRAPYSLMPYDNRIVLHQCNTIVAVRQKHTFDCFQLSISSWWIQSKSFALKNTISFY